MKRTLLIISFVTIICNISLAYEKADKLRFPLDEYVVGCNGLGGTCVKSWHLGEDAEAKTPTVVKAIGKGIVRHAKDHPKKDDKKNYGGMYIIEHEMKDGTKFCTVYAHMNFDSFTKKKDDAVYYGEPLGEIGTSSQNGGWPEHLHFGIRKGVYPDNPSEYTCGNWIFSGYTTCKSVLNNWYSPSALIAKHNDEIDPQDFGFNSWEQINDFLTIMEMCLIFQTNEEVLQAIEEVVGDINDFRERVVNSLYSQSEILDFIDAVLSGNICIGGNNTKRSSESCYTPVIPGFNPEPSPTPPPVDPPDPTSDIAIRDLKLRKWDSGDWVHEKEITLAAGEEYAITLKSEIENKGSKDQDDIDVDFCFVKDKKDFDVDDDRMRLTDEDEDIESGDTDESRSNEITISLDNDLKQIDIESDEGKFDLDVTEENFEDGFIKLYFYVDAETDDGEDQGVSSESNSDEYAKLVVKIKFPEVETKPASNTVQTVIRTLLLD